MRTDIEMRDRILAPVATFDAGRNVTGANLGALVRRLILFEQVIVDSYGMRELPTLINALGAEQFVALLESRAVLIRADGWTLGEVGDDAAALGRPTPLPLLSFALAPLVPVKEYRKEHISRHLEEVPAMPLGKKTSQRVRQAIVDSLTPFPDQPGELTMAQLPNDLTMRLDVVRGATDWALKEYGDVDVFRAETDIGVRFGLPDEEVDRILTRAVLAVGGLNARFEAMKSYNAVFGLPEPELHLIDSRLAAAMRAVEPERQEERLTRVIELAELPDPETAEGTVNIERLLEARQTDVVVAFRQWLRTLDTATDDEIREQVNSVRERLAEAVYGPTGKLVRFAATAAADIVPFGGLVVSALDEFVLEKVLAQPGPVSFLGSMYPSLFEASGQ